MHKKFLLNILGLMTIWAGTVLPMQAFSASNYATTSKLASGKWVKIAIPENGVYQLTFEELAQMGFSNPESVRIYGHGGNPISEVLDGTAIDDLKPIAFKIFDNKLCFYAKGPVKFTLSTPTSTPHYTRDFNSYSSLGYYFLTENDGTAQIEPTVNSNENVGSNLRSSSLDYMIHEKEMISPGQTGKDLLGEIMTNASIDVPYSLPSLCGDSVIVVNTCAAANVSASSYVTAKINGNDLNYTLGSSKIYAPANTHVYYNYASPFTTFTPTAGNAVPEDGNITVGIYSPSGTVNNSWLDYIILTYYHLNELNNAPGNQLRMGIPSLKVTDRIALNAPSTTQVWNVDNAEAPVSYTLSEEDGILSFTPGTVSNWAQLIAFDPSQELMSINGYTEVENQNIHGMITPDMVIVTCKELIPQAERIAQMHRDNDNMTVHVFDQEKVFNEFSSGTPDGMAIRLMNKMFYDRNSSKFKNLLMLGAGSYDNRKIIFTKECSIITYEASISNDEEYSYVCDDFFGLLDDNSGREPASDYLRIGVGRIPSASVEEAKNNIDKLLDYVNNPDYGSWRNDALFFADNYDDDLHSFQTEGINNIIVDEQETGLMNNKVYLSQFPTDPTSHYGYEARKKLTAKLKEGQYFMTYVGHGDKNSLTHDEKVWTVNEAKNVEYQHLPILTTACCDVARYDCNQRGVVELMFHKQNGGAIAIITSARAVYADYNDALNQAFVRAMFCYKDKGYMPTIGEAYMLCKQSFGKTVNNNKMSFMLLGDPAMKINYPKPFFKITSINGSDTEGTITSGAMQQVTVEAKVYNPDGTSINTNFNGDATLSIYDLQKLEKTVTKRVNRVDVTRDIYYPRELLTRVDGRVENGIFTATTVIPRYILSSGDTGSVKVYAHRDDSDEMVNGSYDKLVLNSYDEENPLTVNDNLPPVIEALYFNDEQEFTNGALIPASSTLYIRATDDYAFNTQSMAIGNSMILQLDGGKTTYPYISNNTVLTDNGKALAIEFPMDLQNGKHTLQYTVYDAAGNKATRSITFLVGTTSEASLEVEQEPAVDEATFNITTELTTIPNVTIKVVNNVGELVWSTTTSEFPYTWNLKDKDGNRVPAGIYRFFGTFEGAGGYGGTEIGHIIVIDPYKTNN